jgi:hypothetical protein
MHELKYLLTLSQLCKRMRKPFLPFWVGNQIAGYFLKARRRFCVRAADTYHLFCTPAALLRDAPQHCRYRSSPIPSVAGPSMLLIAGLITAFCIACLPGGGDRCDFTIGG